MAKDGAPIVVGLTGASGIVFGIRTLEVLRNLGIATHVMATKAALVTMRSETDHDAGYLRQLATWWHPIGDIGASVASGSVVTRGMIIAPCSMNTVAAIATGNTTNLLTRAADVVLKERRRLVVAARESPLHATHLRNMLTITELGAIVAPPVPAFYARPTTLQDMVDHFVGRMLQLFDIETNLVHRWRPTERPSASKNGRQDEEHEVPKQRS